MESRYTDKLLRLGKALVDQHAPILIPALEQASGFWFGGGNMIRDASGTLYLCGRYRNAGDSRTGLEAGVRGFELALFRSRNHGRSFEKIRSFSKEDLSHGDRRVVSIEGCWLNLHQNKVELYLSSEKLGIPYPPDLSSFQKPGTGVWTLDFIEADSVEQLDPRSIRELLKEEDPRFLHVKDPFVFTNSDGDTVLIFCSHPFSWSSSNSGYAVRPAGSSHFGSPMHTFFPRGYTWDVAMSRLTAVQRVPSLGIFRDIPPVHLCFYDGGESVRAYEEHPQAVRRPRGYSCEELGGLAYFVDVDFPKLQRLSVNQPAFVSPDGTGSSRYVATLETEEGIYVQWMQSQKDLSQPLVSHFVHRDRLEEILS